MNTNNLPVMHNRTDFQHTADADTANGAVIYKGPSMIDGAPIVAVMTGFINPSKNEKTGPMLQVWIMRSDVPPTEAAHNGADESVCGNCPARGRLIADAIRGTRNVERTCYVLLHNAPLAVYRAFHNGNYPVQPGATLPDLCEGRIVRLGAYGDPAAVPMYIWHGLLQKAADWTGYTHQWREAAGLKRWCMASTDTADEYEQAVAAGWRSFRVRGESEPLLAGERVCPASDEAGKLTQCIKCRACSGNEGRGHSSIAIIEHGAGAKAKRKVIPIAAAA